MSRPWAWLRAHLPHRARVADAEAWRSVTPAERPDLFGEVEVCRGCGCTELAACPGGCWWVAAGLCSSCWSGYGGTD